MDKHVNIIGIVCMIFLIGNVISLSQTQKLKVVVLPVIDVSSPNFNELYSSRNVDLDIVTNGATSLKYSDNGNGFVSLCNRCSSYTRTRPFDEGVHNLTIQAVFNEFGNVLETVTNFTVDSKKPVIAKVSPISGFSDGNFNITFEEANPVLVMFNYGSTTYEFRNKTINLSECFKDKTLITCSINVNLTDFDQNTLFYWFLVSDISSKWAQSKINSLKVDFKKPVINQFNYTVGEGSYGNHVKLRLNITEPNFKQVDYIDYSQKSPQLKPLCYSLNKGVCEQTKIFTVGPHNITIIVSDSFGNSQSVNANFIVKSERRF